MARKRPAPPKAPKRPAGEPKPLSDKQQRFVSNYLTHRNAAKAARDAGYSVKTGHGVGWRLLKVPGIASAVKASEAKHADLNEVTAERVIAEFARIGFSNVQQIFGPDGQILRPHEMPEPAARAVAAIDVSKRRVPNPDGDGFMIDEVLKIKLHDKIGALNALAKHTGVLKEPVTPAAGAAWQMDPEKMAKLSDDQIRDAIRAAKALTEAMAG